ncbi:lactate utilization protein C [Marmoricola sp. Leaf446]|uniref:LutC/YkgG family protein n=1 Tax=Marmoricola sp. Leaf446 TaxID=1736379 RepID=UPI0006F54706|nr:LUD domain-containing protein [Marmoricola sp. Leaf446]KQT94027.1 lactate utilization protein C [Marmoricola sp. Leaf446]
MSARDDVLARVRAATATAVAPPLERPVVQSRPGDVDLFVERVADYRAVVERCTPEELGARLAEVVGERRVVVPDGLLEVLDQGGLVLPGAVADDGLAATELDRLDGVVTAATVGIAETGTIVLDHGPGQGRRAVTLVPDLHVCVVRADQVVADVQDAVARLDPARPHTWISGPSATSDIELDRVEGVHGPRQLHVVVVG